MGGQPQKRHLSIAARFAESESGLSLGLRPGTAGDAATSSDGIAFVRLCDALRSRLPERRFRHSVGVARAGERLASAHGASSAAARMAGMLHDVARHWRPAELLAYASDHALSISTLERAAPVLLHARVGADIAQREFGVHDREILSAIVSHTVARPAMSVLDKCVYLADSVEPSRTFPDRLELFELAVRDLDRAFFECVAISIRYLIKRRVPIAGETLEVYNEMVQRYGESS